MSDSINVNTSIRIEGAVQRAASKCCGAKLDVLKIMDDTPQWRCQDCGQPCERVVSNTERMTLHA